MRALSAILLIFIITHLSAQQNDKLVKVTDMLKIKQLNSVAISPDGSKAAFVVNSIEPDGDNKWEYKYVSQVYLVPADGSAAPKQLTREPASQPAWSPDGKQIAFVRAVDGRPQVFILSLDGGEAFQLTKYKYGAAGPKWSPDGKQILFSASIPLKDLLKDTILNPGKEIPEWPYEKPGFGKNQQFLTNTAKPDPDGNTDEIRAYLENNATDRKAKVFNKMDFQEESTTSPEMSFTHFFVMPMAIT
jgi:dipeptidyl aminopeptidase/acylaminoacyl peptidase